MPIKILLMLDEHAFIFNLNFPTVLTGVSLSLCACLKPAVVDYFFSVACSVSVSSKLHDIFTCNQEICSTEYCISRISAECVEVLGIVW